MGPFQRSIFCYSALVILQPALTVSYFKLLARVISFQSVRNGSLPSTGTCYVKHCVWSH